MEIDYIKHITDWQLNYNDKLEHLFKKVTQKNKPTTNSIENNTSFILAF